MLRPLTHQLTPEEKARWRRKLTDPLTVAFTVAWVVVAIVLVMWGGMLFRLRREMTLLRIDYSAHLKDRAEKDDAVRAELDTIYRTLYSPPEAAPADATRQPSTVELWQRNRDKELRDRINRLEQWRLKMER